ncbi:MAG TPA: hypothetical protein PK110_03875 [Niabella sp.]|nr:hypothetical protein [Chitinophagaceae bacterium]HRO83938.1 hypothetical protein [Niabella sp.]
MYKRRINEYQRLGKISSTRVSRCSGLMLCSQHMENRLYNIAAFYDCVKFLKSKSGRFINVYFISFAFYNYSQNNNNYEFNNLLTYQSIKDLRLINIIRFSSTPFPSGIEEEALH